MDQKITPDEFIDRIKQLPKEAILEGNEKERLKTEKDYKNFSISFEDGQCYYCSRPLKTFSEKNSCLHWLLRPKGFKKKHFPILYEKFTFFRISSYVRWVATIGGPMKNINDIQAEHPGGKLIDFTARFKYITWSFSCGKSDYEGHKTTKSGNFPHYHMQIKLNGNIFIRYNDFHIPFHNDDLFYIELFTKHKDFAVHSYGHGAGMQELMKNKEGLQFIVDNSVPTDNFEDATSRLTTMVMAKDGETISGNIIADAMKEAKESERTFASIIQEKLSDSNADITTIVSPGDGVPESQQRTGRKKKK